MGNNDKMTDSNYADEPAFLASDKEILDQMDYADIIKEAESARERIYDLISSKQGFEKENKRKKLLIKWYYWPVAASVLFLSSLGFLLYQSGSGIEKLVATPLEANNPNGSMLEIILPDSTRVFLNAGSTLQYPSSFVEDQRVVKLNGEAFFDVTKDPAKPFIIKTCGMEVKVLGTRFNLKSFEDENVVQLTLEEGAVTARAGLGSEIQEVSLVPGNQLMLNKATGEITNRKVELQQYAGWTTGKLFFYDNTFEEIAHKLEKRFGVEISIESESIRNASFYCQFGQEDSLERILRLLTFDNNWSYKISGKYVQIIQ